MCMSLYSYEIAIELCNVKICLFREQHFQISPIKIPFTEIS